MKRNIAPTLVVFIAFAAFVVSIVPTVQARTCSNATAVGAYGFSGNGSIIRPTGPVPVVQVGRITEDEDGNVAGTEIVSVGGVIGRHLIKGTISVNSDCTGTITIQTFEPSGAPLGRSTASIVLVDNGRKQLGIFIELLAPNGTVIPTATSILGERLFPGHAGMEEAASRPAHNDGP